MEQNKALEQMEEGSRGLPVRVNREALAHMRQDLQLLGEYVASVLEREVDFGSIPGVPQPFLWEPGADKVLAAFNCYPRPVVLQQEVDEVLHLITYIVSAEVVNRQTGEVVATGIGVASTREGKYGARWVENPQDYGLPPESLRHRSRLVGGRTVTQWRIPNPEWGDLLHTLLQMAYKRAKVDAVQGLPGASSALRRLFTNKPPQTTRQAPRPEAPGPLPVEEDTATPNWVSFWGEMDRLGLLPEKVHEVLGVKSLKDDWVAKGHTIEEARQLVLQRLGITSSENPFPEDSREEVRLQIVRLLGGACPTASQMKTWWENKGWGYQLGAEDLKRGLDTAVTLEHLEAFRDALVAFQKKATPAPKKQEAGEADK